MSLCQFFLTPSEQEQATFKINDPDIVFGCENEQGDGPLFFFVPVDGGAVRVGVCPKHGAHLERLYGGKKT